MEKIFASLAKWHQEGMKTALAVVTRTWGSAPRGVGSLMAIAKDGRFEGSVSGGCVEGTVIAEALALIEAGGTKCLSFTVASEQAWEVGLACGGQIDIQVVALGGAVDKQANSIIAAITNRQCGRIAFSLVQGTFNFLEEKQIDIIQISEEILSLKLEPKCRLVLIGAVHIAQYLAPMAIETGFDVTVIDPRATFTESRDFGAATIVEDWPDEVFARQAADDHTAIVTLTHDPKIDDAALAPALKSSAFYIGCLGSKKTHAARLSRLQDAGFGAESLGRIHGPVGLNIGAKNPAEIAVSILAEIIQVQRHTDAI
ncbi:MAG: XdhC family protein [Alphaproteobacteria bacterium]|nr:XdhC family protein [Alphaproteobacteria bacterium]